MAQGAVRRSLVQSVEQSRRVGIGGAEARSITGEQEVPTTKGDVKI
jgi:hypothetical protein